MKTYYEKPKRIEKLSQQEKLDLAFDLIQSLRLVRSPFESAIFLQDLLTASEIGNLSVRLRIAKLLLKGNTHREIIADLHCSYGTVAKVSIWLNYAGEGFRRIISKLPERRNFPKPLPRMPVEYHLPQILFAMGEQVLAKNELKMLEKYLGGINTRAVFDKQMREKNKQSYSSRKK